MSGIEWSTGELEERRNNGVLTSSGFFLGDLGGDLIGISTDTTDRGRFFGTVGGKGVVVKEGPMLDEIGV